MSVWKCLSCNVSIKACNKSRHLSSKKHAASSVPTPTPTPVAVPTPTPVPKSCARQAHGFDFEHFIIDKFGLIKSKSYTSEYDAFEQVGDQEVPVSIKYIKEKGSIDLGDYFRNANKNCDFIMYVGFWKLEKNIKKTTRIYRFEIDHKKWVSMFQFESSLEMKTELKYITNLRADDDRWSEYCNRYKKMWNSRTRECQLRFKRDHKTQKRIQCGINQKEFFKMKINFNNILVQ